MKFILILLLIAPGNSAKLIPTPNSWYKEYGECVQGGQAYMHSEDVRSFKCLTEEEYLELPQGI